MEKITIECDIKNVSDGHHTIYDLYAHRHALFIALMLSNLPLAWKSICHADGSRIDDWFIAGMRLPSGDITYHLPMKYWESLAVVKGLSVGLKWDGHSANDVVARLLEWSLNR